MRRTTLVACLVVLGATGAARAGEPELRSASAFVIDADGREILAKHADDVRPIASMTKIFAAIVVRARQLDLGAWTPITDADVRAGAGGAASALYRGQSFRNLDLLHAMLLVSDNRVPTALARSVGLAPDELLAEMNQLAAQLRLEHTRFEDVTGIVGNRSTAREMASALQAALADPVLARILRTRVARIQPKNRARTIEYKSTVGPLWRGRYAIRGGKTGTTEAAGHCMAITAEIGGTTYTMVFLGAPSAGARNRDFDAVARWLARR